MDVVILVTLQTDRQTQRQTNIKKYVSQILCVFSHLTLNVNQYYLKFKFFLSFDFKNIKITFITGYIITWMLRHILCVL